ncbi:beta-lactamase family protein [Kribbella sp. NBC_01245]|uniref:serine hydrolase domain-containing protein n=1 Tax=Kribbella sp. NBC_01245 TaxID=2903578 RepID=UPI002E29132E|nr:serine hydrolase domain-containing protein [Kribbella sp. NBC_01245]
MASSMSAAVGLRKTYEGPETTTEKGRGRMPRGIRRMAGAVLAVALLVGVGAPGVATAEGRRVPLADGGQGRPELQEAIQEVVDSGFAGVQMRVNDERGEWVGSAGARKLGEGAKPSTSGWFWVGSVTKNFVATLVLQLVAEGKVGLDGSVAGYLPEFKLDRRITVRMLLQHTSGLFNYTGEFYDDGTYVPGIPGAGKEWVDNRFRTYRPEELVRLALSKPAKFAPGTNWSYANTNYTLAVLLVEKVTGRSYAEEMKRRILRPLGMKGTVVPGNRTQLPGPHAHGYYRYQDAGQWKTVDVTRQNLSLLAGAGDMISTTEDLHTYFSALNGGKLLPAQLLAEMRKPHPKSGDFHYGLGLFVQDLGPECGGTTILHHNGGPPGGYGALMVSTPDGRKTLTASITTGDAAIDLATEFWKAFNMLAKEVFCGGKAAG